MKKQSQKKEKDGIYLQALIQGTGKDGKAHIRVVYRHIPRRKTDTHRGIVIFEKVGGQIVYLRVLSGE